MKIFILLASVFCSSMLWSQNISLELFKDGFTGPVEIAHTNDSRLFVVQQNGIIKILQPDGTVNAANFIDLSSKIKFGGERGLLGLAFHPQYESNGYFFVYYNNTSGAVQVTRYSVNSTNSNIADISSEKILLVIPKPFDNHNGGSMHFASDGKLWISTGDGGSGGDPNNNSQNKNSLLGKMLRIDVDASGPYNIPTDNPFATTAGADEIWAYGLRNAWKFSFDETSGNALIADVGQGVYEEINKMPISQAGINYGWRCYEGNADYNTASCPPKTSITFPLAVYDHSSGKCSITGGYVYRGTKYPDFIGKYFFADYCSKQIGILNPDNSIVYTTPFSGDNFSTFGEDDQKELYVAAVNSGKIYKIKSPTLAVENNQNNAISIYPNPAKGTLFIIGLNSGPYSAEVFDFSGKKALDIIVNENGSINISSLRSGIYFLTLKSGNSKIYSQKILVK